MSQIDFEIIKGSSIPLTFTIKVNKVLADPTVFEVVTISPTDIEFKYTFPTEEIVNPSVGIYEFASLATDEIGHWAVESDSKFTLGGGKFKVKRTRTIVTASKSERTLA